MFLLALQDLPDDSGHGDSCCRGEIEWVLLGKQGDGETEAEKGKGVLGGAGPWCTGKGEGMSPLPSAHSGPGALLSGHRTRVGPWPVLLSRLWARKPSLYFFLFS